MTGNTVTVSRTRRPLLAVAMAALLATAVLGLTACDPKEAGSAAVVEGTRVTETTVNQQAQAVQDVFRSSNTPLPVTTDLLTSLVSRDVLDLVVAKAAQREGITITQGQIDTLISANGGRAKISYDAAVQENAWVPPTGIDTLARTYLTQQALANKLAPGADQTTQSSAIGTYLVALAKELGISVSPRYGVWDADKLAVNQGSSDFLPPLPTPSATPSAG